jgi:hypothetical protein
LKDKTMAIQPLVDGATLLEQRTKINANDADLDSRVTAAQSTANAKYAKPSTGIPAADLDAVSQAALTAASTAVQPSGLNAAAVGLGNVNNTPDASKPVSTAQAAADALRVPIAGIQITANRALTAADAGANLINSTSTAYTVTLIPGLGRLELVQSGTGTLTATAGTATLTGTAVTTGAKTRIVLIEVTAGAYQVFTTSSSSPGFAIPIGGLISGLTDAATKAANTATILAALAAPGAYALPVGDFAFNPFTITSQVVLYGQGANNAYGPINATDTGGNVGTTANTVIRSDSTTADLVTVSATGCVFKHIHFANGNVTSTAGAALNLGPDSTHTADGFIVNQCSFKGFYRQIYAGNSVGYRITENVFLNPSHSCIWIDNTANVDEGDPTIALNSFNSSLNSAQAAVYFKSGGGLKITGNKINCDPPGNQGAIANRFKYGIHIDNPTGGTSVLVMVGNSVENCRNGGVLVDCSTSGSYSNIIVASNEFFSVNASGAGKSIDIKGRAGSVLTNVNTTGNIFAAPSYGIRYTYIKGGEVSGNSFTDPYDTLFTRDAGVTSVRYQPSNTTYFGAASCEYYRNNDVGLWNAAAGRNQEEHKYAKDLYNVTKSGYVILATVATENYAALTIKVKIIASATGVGQSTFVAERLFSSDFSANQLFATPVADYGLSRTAGATVAATVTTSVSNPKTQDIDLSFDTSVVGYLQVFVKVNAASSATGLTGTCIVEIDGAVAYAKMG